MDCGSDFGIYGRSVEAADCFKESLRHYLFMQTCHIFCCCCRVQVLEFRFSWPALWFRRFKKAWHSEKIENEKTGAATVLAMKRWSPKPQAGNLEMSNVNYHFVELTIHYPK